MKENFNFTKVPQRDFLQPYILLALHWAGGDAKKKEVVNFLADKFTLTEELLKEKTEKAQAPRFDTRVSWAGTDLVLTGYIKKGERGIWYLSDKGEEAVKGLRDEEEEALIKFRKRVSEEYKKISKGKGAVEVFIGEEEENLSPSEKEGPPLLDKQKKRDLARITKGMDPLGFERLCHKLMKKLGYKDVKETSRSRDGGIDGIGFLEHGLLRFKVVLQVKKQTAKVVPEKIRALSGAKDREKAERAVFITTSDFTPTAKEEAATLKILLVNGTELIKLLYENDVGYEKGPKTLKNDLFKL